MTQMYIVRRPGPLRRSRRSRGRRSQGPEKDLVSSARPLDFCGCLPPAGWEKPATLGACGLSIQQGREEAEEE